MTYHCKVHDLWNQNDIKVNLTMLLRNTPLLRQIIFSGTLTITIYHVTWLPSENKTVTT